MEDDRKKEGVQVFKIVRACSAAAGVVTLSLAWFFPNRIIVGLCALGAYTCYELYMMSKNCQDLYTTANPWTQRLAQSSTPILLELMTKGAPLSAAILPAVMPDDFHTHFFP